jgi:S1-C subfamily serine protease
MLKSLGTVRESYAVVLNLDGLLVTMGYLIAEAEAVTVSTKDGREVPAEILAYDHNTSFGSSERDNR